MGPNCVASSRSARKMMDRRRQCGCGYNCRLFACSSTHPFFPLIILPASLLSTKYYNVTIIVPPVQGSVVFTISDNNEQWYLDLKSEKPSAGKLTAGGAGGAPANPDLSVKVSESDMIKMVRKELNPQQAFMKGKLKIKGKMALAMKLTSVLAATSRYLPKSKL